MKRKATITAEQVAYAAVTYAKAKGGNPDDRLFALKSDAQMTLAAALYDAFPDVVFHRVAAALQCPKDDANRLNMAMRGRRKSGRNIDEALIAKCATAAKELRVVFDPPAMPPTPVVAKPSVSIVRTVAPPPDRRFPPQGQFRKPITDLDKEIYGTPLTGRPRPKFMIVEDVTAALMGDPEPRA